MWIRQGRGSWALPSLGSGVLPPSRGKKGWNGPLSVGCGIQAPPSPPAISQPSNAAASCMFSICITRGLPAVVRCGRWEERSVQYFSGTLRTAVSGVAATGDEPWGCVPPRPCGTVQIWHGITGDCLRARGGAQPACRCPYFYNSPRNRRADVGSAAYAPRTAPPPACVYVHCCKCGCARRA